MKICKDHWSDMRQAVTDRGLEHLVAKSGEAAFENVKRELAGQADKSNFDPLMASQWAIFNAFLRDAGVAGIAFDGCPLCEVDKQQAGLAEDWIEGSADDQLAHAQRLGLAPKAA
jgi:hypothetical protein